ncbi:hypothetical protein HanPSC8_Chr08g0309581 [Helianthus annuus]|uniref:Uncharacterized protein n=1 Tax=Helianthus annuus TaxID=4232 RepID=A0A251UUS2_HELAN|nr:hypothetical protein HanPSC8_Chr08g0309581 [Helianthus annuus]
MQTNRVSQLQSKHPKTIIIRTPNFSVENLSRKESKNHGTTRAASNPLSPN